MSKNDCNACFFITAGVAIGAVCGLVAVIWPFAKKAEKKISEKVAIADAYHDIIEKVEELNALRSVPGFNEKLDTDFKNWPEILTKERAVILLVPKPTLKSKKPRPPVGPRPPSQK